MFRIKTDIRHYRCDSRAKVERLIRNWVIRPADLIHDPDQEQWEPIGEHPSFSPLFDELAERHDNEPNTVVTPEVADKAAQDRAIGDDAADRPGAPAAAVLRRPKSAQKAPPKQPAPPTPSSDVVGVIRDSDEITMMTEKTLDLLTESAEPAADDDDDDKAPAAARVEVDAAIETDADEPDTALATADSAPDTRLDADDVADEPTQLIERPEFDDESEVSEDETSKGDASEDETSEGDDQAPEIAAGQDSDQKAPDDQEEPPDKQEAPQSDNGDHDEAKQRRKPRRHDLPEEVFVTAELTGNSVAESEDEPLDELGALGSDVDDDDKSDDESTDEIDTSPMGSRRESRSSWNIILDEIPPPADDTSDDPVDADSDENDAVEDPVVDEESADALRDTADLEPVDRDEIDPLEDTAELSTDDVDQAHEAAADDGKPDPEALPDDFEIDDDALEEAFDDFEEQAIAARNTADAADDRAAQAEGDDQDATADLEEISILEALPDHDANLGYEVSFPIAITPSQKALSLGIEKTGRAKKSIDRRYPLPRQKTPGQVRTAEYDLSPKSSRFSLPLSPPLMAIAVVVVLILILSVALAIN